MIRVINYFLFAYLSLFLLDGCLSLVDSAFSLFSVYDLGKFRNDLALITIIATPVYAFLVIFNKRKKYWVLWLPVLTLTIFNLSLSLMHFCILRGESDYRLLELILSPQKVMQENPWQVIYGALISSFQVFLGLWVLNWKRSFAREDRANHWRHYLYGVGVALLTIFSILFMVWISTKGAAGRWAPNFMSFDTTKVEFYERIYEKGDKLVILTPTMAGLRDRKLSRYNARVRSLVFLETGRDRNWGNINDRVDFYLLNSDARFVDLFRGVAGLQLIKESKLVDMARQRTLDILKVFNAKEELYQNFYFPWGAIHLPMIEKHLKKSGYLLKSFHKITPPPLRVTTEHKMGLIFGHKNAFTLKAPSGWLLNHEAGLKQGLQAVFYREGESWGRNSSSMYSKAVVKNDQFKTIYDYVEFNKERFEKSGEKGIVVKKLETIDLGKGRLAYVKEWLRKGEVHEAVAYIDEGDVIVLVVMNADTYEHFSESYPHFVRLVKSYRFITDNILYREIESMGKVRKEYSQDMKVKSIAKYFEGEMNRGLGERLQQIIKVCGQRYPSQKLSEVALRISKFGFADRAFNLKGSDVSRCLRTSIAGFRFSAPPKVPLHWFLEIKYE